MVSRKTPRIAEDTHGNRYQEYPDIHSKPGRGRIGIADRNAVYYDCKKQVLYFCELDAEGEVLVEHETITLSNSTELNTFIDEQLRDSSKNYTTTFGDALWYAGKLAQTAILPVGQARVYSLRDHFEIGRQRTAHLFGISPNTVDTQLAAARNKIESAIELASLVNAKNLT